MRPATPARIALATTSAALKAGAAIDLRLRAGDERGQAIDAAGIRDDRLRLRRLRLILRLRTMFAITAMLAVATMFARLLMVTLIGRLVALIVIADKGLLLLLRREARLLAEMRKIFRIFIAVIARNLRRGTVGARQRLALAELLLGRGDQAEIMLGMLVVVFGRDRIAGGARVARELDVFFGDV